MSDPGHALGNATDSAVTADAVQLGRCTVSQLASELSTGPVRGSAVFRTVRAEAADGIRSTAEGDLRDLIAAARLPKPLFNASLYDGDTFIARPDEWWPEVGVAAEADSREWHLSPEAWDRTRSRHDRMGAVGIIPLHFSPKQIRHEPATVARTIRGALERGLQRPPMNVTTPLKVWGVVTTTESSLGYLVRCLTRCQYSDYEAADTGGGAGHPGDPGGLPGQRAAGRGR